MREGVVLLTLWALVLGPEPLRAQERPLEASREAAEHLRATLLGTPVRQQLTIALRSGETLEAPLVDVGDDSFGVWVAPDEETRRRPPLTGARIKRTILYDAAPVSASAPRVHLAPILTPDRKGLFVSVSF